MTDVSVHNRALCAAWLDFKRKRSAPLTLHRYGQRLEELCVWADDRALSGLCLADLESWTERPRRSGGLGAPATITTEVNILRGLFGWACSHGHITVDPSHDLLAPVVKNHNPRPIPVDLWQSVWCDDRLRDAERTMLGLGFFCGLRREEICRLQAKHFVGDQIMHFPRKGDRNDKNTGVTPFVSCARLFAERRPDLLPMPEMFLDPLRRLVGTADPWCLPWGDDARLRVGDRRGGIPEGMTNPDQVNKRVKALLHRLGLSSGLFTPHALRHSFVTYMLQMGVPLVAVSTLANHSSISTTQRYVKVADDPLAEFLGKPLTGTSPWR